MSDTEITVAITRRVRPGKEDEFDAVYREMSERAAGFDGHLGGGHIRAAHPGGEHVIVYRFDSPEHLDAWQDSEDRQRLLAELDSVIEGDVREERSTGLEFWFADPSCAGESSAQAVEAGARDVDRPVPDCLPAGTAARSLLGAATRPRPYHALDGGDRRTHDSCSHACSDAAAPWLPATGREAELAAVRSGEGPLGEVSPLSAAAWS